MKLFTAIAASLSVIAAMLYAAQHNWQLMIWSASTATWQVLYLIELWSQDSEMD